MSCRAFLSHMRPTILPIYFRHFRHATHATLSHLIYCSNAPRMLRFESFFFLVFRRNTVLIGKPSRNANQQPVAMPFGEHTHTHSLTSSRRLTPQSKSTINNLFIFHAKRKFSRSLFEWEMTARVCVSVRHMHAHSMHRYRVSLIRVRVRVCFAIQFWIIFAWVFVCVRSPVKIVNRRIKNANANMKRHLNAELLFCVLHQIHKTPRNIGRLCVGN